MPGLGAQSMATTTDARRVTEHDLSAHAWLCIERLLCTCGMSWDQKYALAALLWVSGDPMDQRERESRAERPVRSYLLVWAWGWQCWGWRKREASRKDSLGLGDQEQNWERSYKNFEGLVPSGENENFVKRHRKGVVVGKKSGMQEGASLPILNLRRGGPCEWKYQQEVWVMEIQSLWIPLGLYLHVLQFMELFGFCLKEGSWLRLEGESGAEWEGDDKGGRGDALVAQASP